MTLSVPLYQAKADFFRTIGHPVRIRVLELLQDGPRPVHELLADIKVESSSLSQQLAVLRRARPYLAAAHTATPPSGSDTTPRHGVAAAHGCRTTRTTHRPTNHA